MDGVKNIDDSKGAALKSFGIFFLLTLIMTWPAVVRPFWIVIDENFDVAVFWWSLWWVKRSIWNLQSSPFWCDFLMYPHGLNVVFQMPSYVYGVLSIPVQMLLGVERGISLSINLVLIGSTLLTGWGMWLLARRITGDNRAAYVAGCAFAFTPFRFWHTGRFHLICTEFVVFYVLAFWVALESGKRKYALAAGILFAAVLYSSPTYALYAALFSVLIAVRFLITEKFDWKNVFSQSVLAGALATALSIPWLKAAFSLMKANPAGVSKGYGEMVKYSGDLMGYFFPGKSQTLLGPLLGKIGDGFPGINGSEIFLGYAVLAMAVIALIRYARRGAGFWLLSAAIFWVFSLGPRLKFFGKVLFPLPYELLLKLGPIFQMDRDPCRYVIIVSLCLSIAAAFGVKALTEKSNRDWVYYLVPLLLLAEFLQAPLPMKQIVFPEIYYSMRRDGENYAVLELPMESPMPRRFARLYATMHQKPIISSIPRRQRDRYDFIEDNRFFKDLYDPAQLIEHPDDTVFDFNRIFLLESEIKYIILHEKLSDPVLYGLWDDFLQRHRPVEIIDEPTLRAYRFY